MAAVLKQPQLASQRPETLNGNVLRSAALLDTTKEQFIAAALKQPQLFCQKPETLNGNVERSSVLLDIAKHRLVAAALRQPQLFYQRPETRDDNVERSAAILGVTKDKFIATALRQPSLFSQRPETLRDNAERSASLLGITREQFIAAALRQPSLFCRRPEGLNDKLLYLAKIGEAFDAPRSAAQLLETVPAVFTCGNTHLHARYILARLGLKRAVLPTLVSLPNRVVSGLILEHFERQIAQTGKGERALQVMHAQGLIATLPLGIAPIPRPPRRGISNAIRPAPYAGRPKVSEVRPSSANPVRVRGHVPVPS